MPFNTTSDQNPNEPKQGIRGKIIYKEGTFDSKGNLLTNGTAIGVSRKIYFYELTGLREVDLDDGIFVSNIYSEIIDSTKSDKNGYYSEALKPGMYSVFIEENDRLYSTLNDDGLFMPVRVYPDSVSRLNVYIDYKANYIE